MFSVALFFLLPSPRGGNGILILVFANNITANVPVQFILNWHERWPTTPKSPDKIIMGLSSSESVDAPVQPNDITDLG